MTEKKQPSPFHTFTPLPPLSIDEFKRLERFARQNDTGVLGAAVPEDGPYIRLVVVVDGNWRLVEQELKRMGRDFNKPVASRFNSARGKAGPA